MGDLKFGTSGVRGLVTDLVGEPAYRYATAFLRHLETSGLWTAGAAKDVLVGRDLRASSPGIARACFAAIRDAGAWPVDCGPVPTPALALAAREDAAPAIMVTGSHIPDDRNGLKFYRPGGAEITKTDEAGIREAFEGVVGSTGPFEADPYAGRDALSIYRERFSKAFAPDSLAGLRIAVFEHSSVARDLMVEVLASLGAQTIPLGRADRFVPVDTEAHRPEDVAQIAAWAREHGFDALVSTDGDADRPLMADSGGTILRGDVLGLLTARALGVETIVTPVTSGSVMERADGIRKVLRTRVGSPFVIEGIESALAAAPAQTVAGFEANGGFLLGSDLDLAHGPLTALSTRDALLPVVAILARVRARGRALADLVGELKPGHTAGNRLQNVPADRSARFLQMLAADPDCRTAFFAPVGCVARLDDRDGVKLTLENGDSLHYRASGNAPELRCYVEADCAERADDLLRWGLERADLWLSEQAAEPGT